MKTDLTKILSVSGHSGLFRYVAQARSGVIAEALADGKRRLFDAKSKISTLEDISVYTSDGELKLKELFLKLSEVLGGGKAPDPKGPEADLKELFAKAAPNYDPARFYPSHMRKVALWYNELLEKASLDFTEEEEGKEEKAD